MEWNAAPVSLATLPLLESTHGHPHPNYYSLPSVGTLQATLKDLLNSTSKRSIWPNVGLAAFPNAKTLDYCIDRYFLHFDKVRLSTAFPLHSC